MENRFADNCKLFGKVLGGLSAVFYVLLAFISLDIVRDNKGLIFFAIIIWGSISSYLSYLLLSSVGEIIDLLQSLKNNQAKQTEKLEDIFQASSKTN